MKYVAIMAKNIPSVEKVMLSCFMSNERARDFYLKMGFVVDPYSPRPRLLRGKTVKPDYEILSLDVRWRGREGDKGERQRGAE